MVTNRSPVVRALAPRELIERAAGYTDKRRSDLYVWMALNRAEFARLLTETPVTWSALALAAFEAGLLSKKADQLTAETVRQTWYRVRCDYGEMVGAPLARAEKAKVAARRKSRAVQSDALMPEPRSGEVAPGVRQIQPLPSPALTGPRQSPDQHTNPVLERLRETMKKAL